MTRIRLKFIYDIEFSMSCEQDDTIGIVKARLQDVEGLTPENIILRWRGNELADDKNLNYYGLTSSNTDRDPIRISYTAPITSVYLKFRHDNGSRVFSMRCDSDDTIGMVKARLEDAEGLTPEKIILRWRGNQLLVDNKNLNYYGLTSSNTDLDPIQISVKNIRNQFGGRRRRRRTKRKGSKKRSRRTRRRR